MYLKLKKSCYALLRVDFLVDRNCRRGAGIHCAGRRARLAGEGIFPAVFGFVHCFVGATKKALATMIKLQLFQQFVRVTSA